jgi:hypothetical protein
MGCGVAFSIFKEVPCGVMERCDKSLTVGLGDHEDPCCLELDDVLHIFPPFFIVLDDWIQNGNGSIALFPMDLLPVKRKTVDLENFR